MPSFQNPPANIDQESQAFQWAPMSEWILLWRFKTFIAPATTSLYAVRVIKIVEWFFLTFRNAEDGYLTGRTNKFLWGKVVYVSFMVKYEEM